jgi:hypothetical protein
MIWCVPVSFSVHQRLVLKYDVSYKTLYACARTSGNAQIMLVFVRLKIVYIFNDHFLFVFHISEESRKHDRGNKTNVNYSEQDRTSEICCSCSVTRGGFGEETGRKHGRWSTCSLKTMSIFLVLSHTFGYLEQKLLGRL